jgi:NAD(P)-dependent dehydrogenase (short-subunit alcohol dehydrogenase family)
MTQMLLQDKVALVTGAAQGIGRAIALTLATEGADVAVVDLKDTVNATAASIRGLGRRSAVATFDISDANAVHSGVAGLVSEIGDFDILVNCAGIVANIAPLVKMDPNDWATELGVNLTGGFNMIQSVITPMVDRGWGRIINISSIAARGGLHNQIGYSATKAGVLGMSRNVTLEHARHGITCNTVLPGMVATETVMAMPEAILEHATASAPAKRLGQPEEVGHLVAFLASDKAGFINGAEIDINGGGHLNTLVLGSQRELK